MCPAGLIMVYLYFTLFCYSFSYSDCIHLNFCFPINDDKVNCTLTIIAINNDIDQ